MYLLPMNAQSGYLKVELTDKTPTWTLRGPPTMGDALTHVCHGISYFTNHELKVYIYVHVNMYIYIYILEAKQHSRYIHIIKSPKIVLPCLHFNMVSKKASQPSAICILSLLVRLSLHSPLHIFGTLFTLQHSKIKLTEKECKEYI